MPTPPLPSRDDDEHGAMPADCRVETLARMLRAAWLQREPVPSAGNFDDLGPIMRQAWMDTGAAVRALVEAKVREAVSDGLESTIPYNEYDTAEQADARAEAYIDSLVARVIGAE